MSKIEVCRLTDEEFQQKNISTWSVWQKEISEFSWKYDETEECFIVEGDIEVRTEQETVCLGPGDFVVFPKNLECYWIIKVPVKKYYHFPN